MNSRMGTDFGSKFQEHYQIQQAFVEGQKICVCRDYNKQGADTILNKLVYNNNSEVEMGV